MYYKTEFTDEPAEMVYESLESCANCWLRKNIEEYSDEENESHGYKCDEVFFMTEASKEEIENRFDEFYEAGKSWSMEPVIVSGEKVIVKPTIEQRVSAVEDALLAMMGV